MWGGVGGALDWLRALEAEVRAAGVSESTVLRGLADLDSEERPVRGRVRRHPGRTPILEREPGSRRR